MDMDNRWRWLRALLILTVAVIVCWHRCAAMELNVYEARALAVMGHTNLVDREILEKIASGREAGFHYLQAEGDVAPAVGTEKVIGVSLSKDRGLVGIFDCGEPQQPLLLAWCNTLPLQEIKIVELEKGRNAILIRELLDERFGAYFLSSFYSLYKWQDGSLQEIWRKVIANEQQWNRKWLLRGEGWQGVSEQAEADFGLQDGRLVVRTICKQTYWSAPAAAAPRTTLQSRTLTQTYRWEPDWQAMVMARGCLSKATSLMERRGNKYVDSMKLSAGEQVAVLEDEGLQSWINSQEAAYWRVKTKSGQVGYILKECLDIIAMENGG
jgi:hypothetical protein